LEGLAVDGHFARGLVLARVDDGGGEALLVERLAEDVAAALAWLGSGLG